MFILHAFQNFLCLMFLVLCKSKLITGLNQLGMQDTVPVNTLETSIQYNFYQPKFVIHNKYHLSSILNCMSHVAIQVKSSFDQFVASWLKYKDLLLQGHYNMTFINCTLSWKRNSLFNKKKIHGIHMDIAVLIKESRGQGSVKPISEFSVSIT